ncbi:MAG: hypothetical protein ACE5JM_04420 [Armatimonadota bacterium]
MGSRAFWLVPICIAFAATVCAERARGQSFAIESSVPTTLSLERTSTGAYRLSHVGKQATDITIVGIAEAGTVVYMLDDIGRPTEKVASKLDEQKTLTFTADAGAAYAIGLPDAVLAPGMTIEIEGEPVLPARGARRVTVNIQNNYSDVLSGSIVVDSPKGYKVTPGRKRRFRARARRDARVSFRLSKQSITLADLLKGSVDIPIVFTDTRGHKREDSISLRIEDNPLRQGVMVETEGLAAEATEGAAIQIRTDKVNVSGDTFSGWNDKDHWLAWHVQIPKTGKYATVFRYCVDQETAHRDFQLDGKYPHEAFKDIALRPTGGWSNTANDWRHHIVRDAAGKPVLIQISAGQHAIRMNPILGDGGCNLDYIMFLPEAEVAR